MYLNYFTSIQQILSGLVVSVVYWTVWVAGSNPTVFQVNFFFFLNWRELHFHEHFQLEISFKCDIKAENSSTLFKFHEERKGLRPVGSNADQKNHSRKSVSPKGCDTFFCVWGSPIEAWLFFFLVKRDLRFYLFMTRDYTSLKVNVNYLLLTWTWRNMASEKCKWWNVSKFVIGYLVVKIYHDNSNSLLTRTKSCFPWISTHVSVIFTRLTRTRISRILLYTTRTKFPFPWSKFHWCLPR